MAQKIKFGTDGWRGVIADEFTLANVERVAYATWKWLLAKNSSPTLVLGNDTRFGGKLFSEGVARVLASMGVKVLLAENDFVSTPMISLATRECGADIGVIITASHNPPTYNGYKLKGSHGGPSSPADVAAIEALIPDEFKLELGKFEDFTKSGMIKYCDIEHLYYKWVQEHFNLGAIDRSNLKIIYDAMYGAGQHITPLLVENVTKLHCKYNPSFAGIPPEPILKNLLKLQSSVRGATGACGWATDGDADRIGMFDEDGNFIDANRIMLLLIHYLHHYKEMSGKVIVSFSVSDRIKKLCAHYGIPYEVTKIGFKYISERMVKEEVLVGGEESGGIAVGGHIPERDGVWDGLLLLEFMSTQKKTLKQLLKEVYDIVGEFSYKRDDVHLAEDLKNKIIANCEANKYSSFGKYKILRTETIDGFKYYFSDSSWVMIRASGTEPLIRIYAEAETEEEVGSMLTTVKKVLLN